MSGISSIYGKAGLRPVNRTAYDIVNAASAQSKNPPPQMDGVIWLRVPYAQKDLVKRLGARWNPQYKCWWTKQGPNLARFSRWIWSRKLRRSVKRGLRTKREDARATADSKGAPVQSRQARTQNE